MKKRMMGFVLAGLATTWCQAQQVTVQQGQRDFGRAKSAAEAQRDEQRWTAPHSVGTTPFMFSFAAPLQAPPANWDVKGFRLGVIYGECVNFDGLDIGLVGRATGHGNGLFINGLATVIDGSGVGWQIAPVNVVEGGFEGMQIGAANYAGHLPGAVGKGLQIGVFNGATWFKGFQLGVINYTEAMVGVQIGVVNIIANKDIACLPIINAAF